MPAFCRNIGAFDRRVRLLAGTLALAGGIYADSWWGLVGLAPILTAILRFCPAYLPLGISTSRSCHPPAR